MSRLAKAEAAQKLDKDLKSPNGRYEIGQTMLEPFKEGRDYISIGRKVFAVHHVEPGAPMWYDLDKQFGCTVSSSLGSAPRVLDGAAYDRVELTPFPIVVLVRIPVLEPAVRRFDVLDREQVRAQAEMAEAEDTEIFSVLRTAASGSGSGVSNGVAVPTAVSGNFALTDITLAMGRLEDAADSNVENILMRPLEYRRIRDLLINTTNANVFDPVTRRELLKTGYMGDLFSAQIRLSKKLQTQEMMFTASPEYLGVISVRIDLSQMDAPMPELLQYGWVLYEYIGIAQLTNVGSVRYSISN